MIKSHEIELIGNWLFDGKKVREDDVTKRIKKLTSQYLVKVKSDSSGWISLYIDPNDYRFWLLDYPDSNLQGGGAPILRNINRKEIEEIFGNTV